MNREVKNEADDLFRTRNFMTMWYMYQLIAGEISCLLVIIWVSFKRNF